ncbi:MAG: hypothetical protein IJ255_06875 [Bacteroidales bacterium]|nr:hypothetical protein [Bacteroidales bacterium]
MDRKNPIIAMLGTADQLCLDRYEESLFERAGMEGTGVALMFEIMTSPLLPELMQMGRIGFDASVRRYAGIFAEMFEDRPLLQLPVSSALGWMWNHAQRKKIEDCLRQLYSHPGFYRAYREAVHMLTESGVLSMMNDESAGPAIQAAIHAAAEHLLASIR